MERIKNWARKIRDRNFVENQIREHDSFETPEDRFRDFLTGIDKKALKKSTVVKKILDIELAKIDIDQNVKLEAQFEKDYPGRKAIWHGRITGLFKIWLKEHKLFDKYLEKDYEN